MSLFDRIKSAVRGNPVTREFELGKHVASAGPGLMWKVLTKLLRLSASQN